MSEYAQGGYVEPGNLPQLSNEYVIWLDNGFVITAEQARRLTANWLRTSGTGGTPSASPDVAPAASQDDHAAPPAHRP